MFFRGNRFLKARDDVPAAGMLSCCRVKAIEVEAATEDDIRRVVTG